MHGENIVNFQKSIAMKSVSLTLSTAV